MTFLHVDKLDVLVVVGASNFPEHREVVVVAEVPGLDVSLVEEVMMADLIAPEFLDVGILELLQGFLFGVVRNLVEMVLGLGGDYNNFVSHCI